jgi:hypothetical protein
MLANLIRAVVAVSIACTWSGSARAEIFITTAAITRKPHAWRSMCGWTLNLKPAVSPARSTMRAKPAVVNGEPRSDVNTNGDLGSCSRWLFGPRG